MRRVLCIALPQIRVEIAGDAGSSRGGRGDPLAVVVARPGGAVRSEREVLGSTRIDVVSREAAACGVRAGQTVASARAKCSELAVRVVAEGAVRSALERVSEVALAFGTSAAFDVGADVVWAEIGGCAHLFGGEHALGTTLADRVRELGHACRVSIADGPRIASMVARFSIRDPSPLVIVPEGNGAAAIRELPVSALDLDGDVEQWFVELGLSTCGGLQALPQHSLGTRLGARTLDVLAVLSGEDRAPLDSWRPPEVPEERIGLEWAATHVEALVFVMKTLCGRLGARLAARAMATSRVVLELTLDRALLPEGASRACTIDLALPAPISAASDLFAVVRARLERVELPAPVLAAALRAMELVQAPARPLDLLAPEPKADRVLPRLVAELAAELGGPRIGTLAMVDTWIPDSRTQLVPYGKLSPVSQRASPRARMVTSALEPSRLVAPCRIRLGSISGDAVLLSRIEGVEWWRGNSAKRDFVAACLLDPPSGEASQGVVAWVEIAERDGWLRGWMD